MIEGSCSIMCEICGGPCLLEVPKLKSVVYQRPIYANVDSDIESVVRRFPPACNDGCAVDPLLVDQSAFCWLQDTNLVI